MFSVDSVTIETDGRQQVWAERHSVPRVDCVVAQLAQFRFESDLHLLL